MMLNWYQWDKRLTQMLEQAAEAVEQAEKQIKEHKESKSKLAEQEAKDKEETAKLGVMPLEEAAKAVAAMSPKRQAAVLAPMPPKKRAAAMGAMSPEVEAAVLTAMSANDVAREKRQQEFDTAKMEFGHAEERLASEDNRIVTEWDKAMFNGKEVNAGEFYEVFDASSECTGSSSGHKRGKVGEIVKMQQDPSSKHGGTCCLVLKIHHQYDEYITETILPTTMDKKTTKAHTDHVAKRRACEVASFQTDGWGGSCPCDDELEISLECVVPKNITQQKKSAVRFMCICNRKAGGAAGQVSDLLPLSKNWKWPNLFQTQGCERIGEFLSTPGEYELEFALHYTAKDGTDQCSDVTSIKRQIIISSGLPNSVGLANKPICQLQWPVVIECCAYDRKQKGTQFQIVDFDVAVWSVNFATEGGEFEVSGVESSAAKCFDKLRICGTVSGVLPGEHNLTIERREDSKVQFKSTIKLTVLHGPASSIKARVQIAPLTHLGKAPTMAIDSVEDCEGDTIDQPHITVYGADGQYDSVEADYSSGGVGILAPINDAKLECKFWKNITIAEGPHATNPAGQSVRYYVAPKHLRAFVEKYKPKFHDGDFFLYACPARKVRKDDSMPPWLQGNGSSALTQERQHPQETMVIKDNGCGVVLRPVRTGASIDCFIVGDHILVKQLRAGERLIARIEQIVITPSASKGDGMEGRILFVIRYYWGKSNRDDEGGTGDQWGSGKKLKNHELVLDCRDPSCNGATNMRGVSWDVLMPSDIWERCLVLPRPLDDKIDRETHSCNHAVVCNNHYVFLCRYGMRSKGKLVLINPSDIQVDRAIGVPVTYVCRIDELAGINLKDCGGCAAVLQRESLQIAPDLSFHHLTIRMKDHGSPDLRNNDETQYLDRGDKVNMLLNLLTVGGNPIGEVLDVEVTCNWSSKCSKLVKNSTHQYVLPEFKPEDDRKALEVNCVYTNGCGEKRSETIRIIVRVSDQDPAILLPFLSTNTKPVVGEKWEMVVDVHDKHGGRWDPLVLTDFEFDSADAKWIHSEKPQTHKMACSCTFTAGPAAKKKALVTIPKFLGISGQGSLSVEVKMKRKDGPSSNIYSVILQSNDFLCAPDHLSTHPRVGCKCKEDIYKAQEAKQHPFRTELLVGQLTKLAVMYDNDGEMKMVKEGATIQPGYKFPRLEVVPLDDSKNEILSTDRAGTRMTKCTLTLGGLPPTELDSSKGKNLRFNQGSFMLIPTSGFTHDTVHDASVEIHTASGEKIKTTTWKLDVDHTYIPQWHIDCPPSLIDGAIAGGDGLLTVKVTTEAGDQMMNFFQDDSCKVKCTPLGAAQANVTRTDDCCMIDIKIAEILVSNEVEIVLSHPKMVNEHSQQISIKPAINGPRTIIMSSDQPTAALPTPENCRIVLVGTTSSGVFQIQTVDSSNKLSPVEVVVVDEHRNRCGKLIHYACNVTAELSGDDSDSFELRKQEVSFSEDGDAKFDGLTIQEKTGCAETTCCELMLTLCCNLEGTAIRSDPLKFEYSNDPKLNAFKKDISTKQIILKATQSELDILTKLISKAAKAEKESDAKVTRLKSVLEGLEDKHPGLKSMSIKPHICTPHRYFDLAPDGHSLKHQSKKDTASRKLWKELHKELYGLVMDLGTIDPYVTHLYAIKEQDLQCALIHFLAVTGVANAGIFETNASEQKGFKERAKSDVLKWMPSLISSQLKLKSLPAECPSNLDTSGEFLGHASSFFYPTPRGTKESEDEQEQLLKKLFGTTVICRTKAGAVKHLDENPGIKFPNILCLDDPYNIMWSNGLRQAPGGSQSEKPSAVASPGYQNPTYPKLKGYRFRVQVDRRPGELLDLLNQRIKLKKEFEEFEELLKGLKRQVVEHTKEFKNKQCKATREKQLIKVLSDKLEEEVKKRASDLNPRPAKKTKASASTKRKRNSTDSD